MTEILMNVALVLTIIFVVLAILVVFSVYRALRERNEVPKLVNLPKIEKKHMTALDITKEFLKQRGE